MSAGKNKNKTPVFVTGIPERNTFSITSQQIHVLLQGYIASGHPGGHTVIPRWHGYLPRGSIVLVVPSGDNRRPGYGSHQ